MKTSARNIPIEIVTLILVRSPVKSLLRFRCVCKAWRDLVGSRPFIDMHLRHPSQEGRNEYLILKRCEWENKNINTVLSFYSRDQDGGDLLKTACDWWGAMHVISISGPVNGICLVATQEQPSGYDPWGWNNNIPRYPLYLCNPATRELRKIPDRPFGRPRARPSMHKCVPYDCKRVGVGFGYDHTANGYKVVSIMLFLEDRYYSDIPPHGPLKIEIYDVSSNSWRVVDAIFPTICIHPDPDMDEPTYPIDLNIDSSEQGMFPELELICGVFFNGSIHWNGSGYHKFVLAFDISDEVMRAFHLPRAISDDENNPCSLFVLNDSLAYVQKVMCEDVDYLSSTSFYVWVMVEYGDEESWIKKFYFQPDIHVDVLAFWVDMLLCESEEDGELISCNFQKNPHQFRKHHHITRYVPESSNQQRVQQGVFWNKMSAMIMYKESLVPLR